MSRARVLLSWMGAAGQTLCDQGWVAETWSVDPRVVCTQCGRRTYARAPGTDVHRCVYTCTPRSCSAHALYPVHVYTRCIYTYARAHVRGCIYACIPRTGAHTHTRGTHLVPGRVRTGCLVPLSSPFSREAATYRVSPGRRSLTLLGEFCLCSRRHQGCAAAGAPLLRGRPQTGALLTCPACA